MPATQARETRSTAPAGGGTRGRKRSATDPASGGAGTRNGTASSPPPESTNGSAVSAHGSARGAGLRSLWKGAISFGLVTIPVKLLPATGSKDVAFHLLHDRCNTRLKQVRWCPVCEREVAWDEVVRGYEYAKGQYVRLTDEDFQQLPVAGKHTIELTAFVREAEIDPVFYEKSYWVEPDAPGRKSFALLLRALQDKGLSAVGRIALRERERLCALRPHGAGLALETLFYADEIREQPTAGAAGGEVGGRELQMAHQLIEYMTEPFRPEQYHDDYREAVMHLIEEKLQGHRVVRSPEEPPGEIVDLMEALRASLAAEAGRDGKSGGGPRGDTASAGPNGSKPRNGHAATRGRRSAGEPPDAGAQAVPAPTGGGARRPKAPARGRAKVAA